MIRNIVAAVGLLACTLTPGGVLAMPGDPSSIVKAARADDPIEKARIVCVNRYTGRIIAYHPCGWRPRVYGYYRRPGYRWVCRNRWTGRIIHYGRC